MATLRELIDYSKANPQSDVAFKLQKAITGGAYDQQAANEGVDLSWAGRPKMTAIIPSKAEPLTTGGALTEESKGLTAPIGSFGKGPEITKTLLPSTTAFGETLGGTLATKTKEAEQLDESRQMLAEMYDKIITRIKEKQEKGEDVSRLLDTLKKTGFDINDEEINPALGKSNKQILGEALGTVTEIAGFASAPTVGVGIAKAPATGIIQGAIQGAKAAAPVGAAFGAATRVSRAAQEDKSTEDLIKEGIIGGLVGAGTAAVLGGVTGGVSGYLQGKELKRQEFIKAFVAPKETPTVKIEAIRQGRLQDPGLFKKATLEASKRDEKLADSISDVVSPKATLGENIDGIRTKINNTNNGVKSYVLQNKVPFNTNQLRTKLNSGKEDLRLIFASDSNAEKTYNAVVDAFMDEVGKKDTAGLLDARQSFDKLPAIKKLLESDRLGENARKEIVLQVRRAANEYVSSLLPKGNKYAEDLLQEHYMIEALTNISEKGASIIGKNKLQLLTEEYPILKWLVGGLVGAAGIGVGGSIIGSTD